MPSNFSMSRIQLNLTIYNVNCKINICTVGMKCATREKSEYELGVIWMSVCWSNNLLHTPVQLLLLFVKLTLLKGICISISHTSSAISRLIKILGSRCLLYMIEIRHEAGHTTSTSPAPTREIINHTSSRRGQHWSYDIWPILYFLRIRWEPVTHSKLSNLNIFDIL